MAKRDSMYAKGMKIAMYSEKEGSGKWYRGGEDIKYTHNRSTDSPYEWYILSFSYEFLYSDDTVSMAYAEPYDFSTIMEDIMTIEKKVKEKYTFNREIL